MVTQALQQRHERSLVLAAALATPFVPNISTTEATYFAGVLDTGDELALRTQATPLPMNRLVAAPTVAAYFVGLLDIGDE